MHKNIFAFYDGPASHWLRVSVIPPAPPPSALPIANPLPKGEEGCSGMTGLWSGDCGHRPRRKRRIGRDHVLRADDPGTT